ncbi:hypothetical protein AJ80_02824 [Polytolypa hystricis UAMH7299]|uniref:Nucleolar protein 16 n=1 Tax=Polytolypa hystricis (strain UAMH7299) TaxID=1447883 RepID=A0A2B7YPR6_POLH7|nr:hypothetical protein AJ80_02824 [Polytolypa hystricis UAMH7299]
MGRELQKKKNRSSIPKIKKKSGQLKNGNKRIHVLGNAIISKNWDKKLTLTQNYRQLGLTSRLNAPTGGVERKKKTLPTDADAEFSGFPDEPEQDELHVNPNASSRKTFAPTEARVERDPETGKILRVIHSEAEENETLEIAGRLHRRDNPLNDPLDDISQRRGQASASGEGDRVPMPTPSASATSEFVKALEKQVVMEEEALKKRRPRQQSAREEEWLERLVEKHGDDVAAMVRDRRLNRMQQTAGDINRRLRKWKEKRGEVV